MPANQSQRPKFYEEQYLGAADLTAAVDYSRIQQARHALGAHTWGIAAGLQLKEKEAPTGGRQMDVFIQPGYAWDGFGRPIVVLAPYKIPAELFKSIPFDAGSPAGQLIKVWLRYDESATQRARSGFEVCDQADQFSRVQETFRIEIGERPNHDALHDTISVAGYVVDAQETLHKLDPTDLQKLHDESVSYQNFPEGGQKARWLIPLGVVRWQPNSDPNQPGAFAKRSEDDLKFNRSLRRYIGVVAEAVEAADSRIRLKGRAKDYPLVVSDDLVWVEGDLRVEGDVRLFDHKLDFKDSSGRDNGIPLSISRVDELGKGSLRAIIGKSGAGTNTFVVGPLNGNKFDTKLTVRDDGNVGIGTDTPGFKLDVADRMRVRQGSSPSGSAGIWFFQNAPNADCAFVGMATDNRVGFYGNTGAQWGLVMDTTSGNVGIGTTNPTHKFHVLAHEAVGLFESTGSQAYLRIVTNEGMANRVEITNRPGGRLSLWTGEAGDALNVTKDGNVGIGTTAPALKLDIQGDFGRSNGPATLNLHGSRIGDIGGGILFLRSGGDVVTFDGNDKIGIGTRNPVSPLDVVGDVHVTGTVFASAFSPGPSDRSLKKDITSLTGALHKLLQLHGVNFRWNEPEKVGNQSGPQIGLIAQEVEKVFPDWVTIAPNGYKALTIRGFEALTIEALRELHDEIEALKTGLHKLNKNQPPSAARPRTGKGKKEPTHETRD